MGIENDRLRNIEKLRAHMVGQVMRETQAPQAVASNVANVLDGPIAQLIEFIDELTARVDGLQEQLAEQSD
jgi:hypothetical protein